MASSSTNAVENNNKLFPIVASKLSQKDPATYLTVAQKFGHWLSNEKAYYTAARPEIIKLLGIAHMSLRRAVGADINPKAPFHISTYLSHPMIGPYSRLLKAVYPYKHLFVEEDLQEQLRSLFNTIMAPNALSETAASSGSTVLAQSRSASLARHGHIMTMQPSSSSLASALEMRSTPTPPHGLAVGTSTGGTISPQSSQILHPIAQYPTSHVVSGLVHDQTEGGPVRSSPQNNPPNLHQQGLGQVSPLALVSQSAQTGGIPHLPGSTMSLTSPSVGRVIPQGGFSTALTQEIPAAPSPILLTNVPGGTQPPIKPKKKRKRPLASDIVAKDIEELNRKRSIQQELRTPVKEETTEATQLSGNISTSVIVPDPPVAIKEARPLTIQYPGDDLAATDTRLETLTSNDVPLSSFREAPSHSRQAVPQLPDHIELDQSGASAASMAEAPDVTSDHMVLDQPEVSPDPVTELESSASPNQLLRVSNDQYGNPSTVTSVSNDQNITLNTSNGANVEMADSATAPGRQEAQTVFSSSIPADDLRSADETVGSEDHNVAHVEEPLTLANFSVATEDSNENSLSLLGSAPSTAIQFTVASPENVSLAQLSLPANNDKTVQIAHLAESMAEPVIGRQSQGGSMEAEPQVSQPPHSSSPQISSLSHAINSAQAGPSSLVFNLLPPGSTPVLANPAAASLDTIKGSIEESIDKVAQISAPPSASSNPISIVPSLLDSKVIGSEEVSDSAVRQPMILPISTTPTPELISEARQPEAQTNMDAFGSEMRILAFQRGLQSKSKVTIRFDIPQEQYAAIQLWNNRKKLASTTDLRRSLCLSLGCYSTDISKDVNNLTELSALPSHWPQAGELFMNILHNGQRKYFSLSPPSQVAPNGLVDVSKFLQSGSNTIELSQRSDIRGYVFILRAHYPTRSQLEEVVQRHKKDQDWQDWLRHVCRPMDVPIPKFS